MYHAYMKLSSQIARILDIWNKSKLYTFVLKYHMPNNQDLVLGKNYHLRQKELF